VSLSLSVDGDGGIETIVGSSGGVGGNGIGSGPLWISVT